jgi:ABC-2 type transport system permease protein
MRGFAEIVLREWRFLLRDLRFAAVMICGPLFFGWIVGSVYSERKIEEIPATIVDQDHSALSRDITEAVLATEPFTLGQYASSSEEFERLAAEGKAHVCFAFPPNFERDIRSGKTVRVAVLVDASNLITGNVAVTAANSVLGSYSVAADVKKIRLHGWASDSRARQTAMPVVVQTRTIFNPAFNANYANFLVLGFTAIAIQLAPLLTACRAGARELGPDAAGLRLLSRNPAILAAAKCTACITIIWPVAWLTLRLAMWNFRLPMAGSEWMLAFMSLWFVTNMVALGFAISGLTRDGLFGTEICALLTMPNFLLSGFTWPIFAMPRGLQVLAYALPMNPLVFSLRKITLMNATPGDLLVEFRLLAAWTLVSAVLAWLAAARIFKSGVQEEAEA